jgi:hypothetical protein
VTALLEADALLSPFRHEALLYEGDAQYLDGTVPFVEEGLAAGEPVLVAVPGGRLDLLRGELPTDHPLLHLADMEAMGRNPARIIPAWEDFARPLLASGRTARGIGEPAWPGRSAEELIECAWHETLLNTAFADAAGFSLLCPYDAGGLDSSVVEVRHGGGRGRLCTWVEEGAFLCEVHDTGVIEDPLAGRRRPGIHQSGGRGLWLITQLCDLVQIRRRPDGQVIRMRLRDRG